MCGISGFISLDQKFLGSVQSLRDMTSLIRHRGPDDEGYYLQQAWDVHGQDYSGADSSPEIRGKYPALLGDASAALGLGFRRLAILDLSAGGHQPMSDPERGTRIVFNGEIYNYVELRKELADAGCVFRSSSDTEVILKAYAVWGTTCVKRFNGIWAFAIWDDRDKRLFCSRDRFGVKPFYYRILENVLYFGSELKQLIALGKKPSLNLPMIWRSMKINSLQVYGEETFWEGTLALEPGCNLLVDRGKLVNERYHQLDPKTFGTSKLSFPEAVARYREHFNRAMNWQLRSDVEVGACLSGGLDSSAIVCAAAQQGNQKLKTFSSYFSESPVLDERTWIAAVTAATGTESHLVSPEVGEAIAWLPEATWFNDLPLGAGFAAQYAVMRLAAESGIKVLLDGQGSDEITAGYRHAQYRYQAQLLRGGKFFAATGEYAAFFRKHGIALGVSGIAKSLLCCAMSEHALYTKEFDWLRFDPFTNEFRTSCRKSLSGPVLGRITDPGSDKLENFLFNSIYTTSLPTLLHWEDRMSMAVSVESRVPFLDHELVEFGFTLPSSHKIHKARGKLVHRQAIRDLVPSEIFDRKDKSVFGSPFHTHWMRAGMASEIEYLLSSTDFRERGIWDLAKIGRQWRMYKKGDNSQAEMLFNVFALENWFRVYN